MNSRHPVIQSSSIARTEHHFESLSFWVDEHRRILNKLLVSIVRSDVDSQAHLLLIGELLESLETDPVVASEIAESFLVVGPHAVERRVQSVDAVEHSCPAALFHLAVDACWNVRLAEVDVVDAVEFDAACAQDLVAVRWSELVFGFEHHFGARECKPVAVLEPVA